MCSLGSDRQYVIIGSENGLAPKRWQAIIWTNDGVVYWRIYESPVLNELKMWYEIFKEKSAWDLQLIDTKWMLISYRKMLCVQLLPHMEACAHVFYIYNHNWWPTAVSVCLIYHTCIYYIYIYIYDRELMHQHALFISWKCKRREYPPWNTFLFSLTFNMQFVNWC